PQRVFKHSNITKLSSDCSSGCAQPRPAQAPPLMEAHTSQSVPGIPSSGHTTRQPDCQTNVPRLQPYLPSLASVHPRCQAPSSHHAPSAWHTDQRCIYSRNVELLCLRYIRLFLFRPFRLCTFHIPKFGEGF